MTNADTVAARTPPPKLKTPALAVLFATVFINLVGFGLVVPLLPFFAQSLKAEAWQITLMFSAYSLGQFFAEPFWGRLSDRIGRKPVLLMTLIANALGYLMLAFVPNIWLAIAVRLFTGLGAGNISTVQGYVADVTPPEQRAGRMGLIGAAFGLGFIVGPGLGGLLTQPQLGRLGYQLPIFLAAALAAVAAVGVVVFLRESRAKADPAAPRPAFLAGLKDARDNAVVSRVLVVTLIYMAGFSAMESVFGLWSESRYQWGAREVGLSFMIVGIVSTLNQGSSPGGWRDGSANRACWPPACCCLELRWCCRCWRRSRGSLRRGSSWAPHDAGRSGLDHSDRNGDWRVRHVAGHAKHLGHDQPRLAARSAGAMLGLNMASSSVARIFGPMIAGALFSGLGHDWPFVIGALLTIPAALMAINAGRVIRSGEGGVKAPA